MANKVEKTEDNYEDYLNYLYAEEYAPETVFEQFEWLTNQTRPQELWVSENELKAAISSRTFGTMLRKYASITFMSGYNDWNP